MPGDELFRRSFEAGTQFFGMTRERAEALVKDLVKQGQIQKKKAQKAVDELVDRSRQASEQLRQVIDREIGEQLSSRGVATKDDIRTLEQRIDELAAAKPAGPSPTAGDQTSGEPPAGGAAGS